jgi:hypothetical protein
MMPRPDRKLEIQLSMERQLRPLMSSEAVEVLAKCMAHLVNKDITQFSVLTEQFRTAFAAEHAYLAECRSRIRTSAATDPGPRGIS